MAAFSHAGREYHFRIDFHSGKLSALACIITEVAGV